MAAGITLIDMPAQDRTAARFDGRHGFELIQREAVGFAKLTAVLLKDFIVVSYINFKAL